MYDPRASHAGRSIPRGIWHGGAISRRCLFEIKFSRPERGSSVPLLGWGDGFKKGLKKKRKKKLGITSKQQPLPVHIGVVCTRSNSFLSVEKDNLAVACGLWRIRAAAHLCERLKKEKRKKKDQEIRDATDHCDRLYKEI